ncbi:MAG TPA: hypothetical protein VFW96_20240 [Thermomicrobiales bacterium]|nr:hypothetical protein [Thermomicrobiales bacterium]
MAELWPDYDCAAWARALAAYPAAVAARGASRLPELDAWYREELPGVLAGRAPMRLTHGELVRVTEWKMKRGVWRARNLALVRGNDPAEVRRLSVEAFALMPEPRQPVARLATLAGVGPATASAVLAAARPDVYPFFDEVIAAQIPDLGPVAFTPAYYARYAERLRERAARLAATCPDAGWTAHAAGQALWAVGSSASSAAP